MRLLLHLRLVAAAGAAACLLHAQVPPGGVAPSRPAPPEEAKPVQAAKPAPQQQPGQTPAPQQQQPGQPAPQTAPPTTQPQIAPNAPRLTDSGAFMLSNASLTEMIRILASRLKINYIIDPAVNGAVSIYTFGEVKPVDEMQLLETILRINGATIVKVGDLYRIIPIAKVSQMPITPSVNGDSKTLPDDERMILNLIFLKFATAAETAKLLQPFLGEGGVATPYDPANLLIIQDNARSMRRYMELLALFDSDTFAGQRVRLFEVENSRPTDLQKELESVFRAYALSDKSAAVKFVPVDRINTIIAVAPNPGIFTQVEDWIKKLDVSVKSSAGSVNTYVYRLKYGRADVLSMAIMALYSGNPMALMALGQMAMMNNGMSSGLGGGIGGGGYFNGGANSPYGANVNGYGSMSGLYSGGLGGGGLGGAYPAQPQLSASPLTATGLATPQQQQTVPGAGQTGQYLGDSRYGNMGMGMMYNGPRVIPNPLDNTLLIMGTAQEYEQVVGLLRQLDVAPRQVLIDAKIYEVDLTGDFEAGVSAFLEKKDSGPNGSAGRQLNVTSSSSGLNLTTGLLVTQTKELLAAITAHESTTRTHVLSAPSIIATDSIAALLNVGTAVPTLTSQAVAGGVQVGGNSLFSNTVNTVSTGITLAITARVNSSGVVTMIINQDVSSPQPPSLGGIQSPSFSNRSFSTQVTVQDGQMVAIGGAIQEQDGVTSGGVPLLHRIPLLGAAFGAKSTSKSRTELVVFITPRVIYDSNQLIDATDEIKGNLKKLQKLIKE